ncbi:hypothetical protein HK104_006642 [Borealophlyctis nickersoniae]|nr:hypothetical protein HK104_006642 [Borealophlyctis nickersoniae]
MMFTVKQVFTLTATAAAAAAALAYAQRKHKISVKQAVQAALDMAEQQLLDLAMIYSIEERQATIFFHSAIAKAEEICSLHGEVYSRDRQLRELKRHLAISEGKTDHSARAETPSTAPTSLPPSPLAAASAQDGHNPDSPASTPVSDTHNPDTLDAASQMKSKKAIRRDAKKKAANVAAAAPPSSLAVVETSTVTDNTDAILTTTTTPDARTGTTTPNTRAVITTPNTVTTLCRCSFCRVEKAAAAAPTVRTGTTTTNSTASDTPVAAAAH